MLPGMAPPTTAPATAPAAGPLGVFTRDDLRALGIPEDRVRRWVADGRWHRVRRGVLVDGARWRAGDDRDRHLLRLAAALRLDRSGEAVASGASAVLALGLPLVGPVPEIPELTVPRDRRGCLTGVEERTTRTPLPPHERVQIHGLLVTSPARTLIDLALRGRRRDAVIAADAALALGLLDRSALATALVARQAAPQAHRLDVLQEATAHAGPPAASVLRRAALDAGLPAPDRGQRIALGDGSTEPLLAVWSRERVVVIGPSPAARRAMEALGYRVLVVNDDDVFVRTPVLVRALAYALSARAIAVPRSAA
jgi:hypothetical protein